MRRVVRSEYSQHPMAASALAGQTSCLRRDSGFAQTTVRRTLAHCAGPPRVRRSSRLAPNLHSQNGAVVVQASPNNADSDDTSAGDSAPGNANSNGPDGGPSKSPAAKTSLTCEIAAQLIPLAAQSLNATVVETDSSIEVAWLTKHGAADEVDSDADDEPAPQILSGPADQWQWPGEKLDALLSAANDGGWSHASPDNQPERLHEFSSRLLAPYSAKAGHVHLGGCALDWVPLWRLACVSDGAEREVSIRFTTSDGQDVGERVVDEAGLSLLSHIDLPPISDAVSPPPARDDAKVVLATCVWCCWASGKVVAEIDEQSLTVEFDGWAMAIADGHRELPPFRIDGVEGSSYSVELDDEGDISPSDAIEVCSQSGRRLLRHKLRKCSAGVDWAEAEFLSDCPVSGNRLITSKLVECNMCSQPVSPSVVRHGRCQVCRTLEPVNKEDARLAMLIGEFPRLSRWSSWRIGESDKVFVMTAGALLRRLLVVVCKETMEPIRLATGLRWVGGWSEVTDEFRREMENDRS